MFVHMKFFVNKTRCRQIEYLLFMWLYVCSLPEWCDVSTATTKTTQHSQPMCPIYQRATISFSCISTENNLCTTSRIKWIPRRRWNNSKTHTHTSVPSDERFITHQKAFPYQWRIAKTADNQGTLENCITFRVKCLARGPLCSHCICVQPISATCFKRIPEQIVNIWNEFRFFFCWNDTKTKLRM